MRLGMICLSLTLVLAAATAVACEYGASVTFVNDTDLTVSVEVSDGGETPIQPHSNVKLAKIGREDDPYVIVVRDEEGNTLYYEETVFREADGRTIVIVEPTASPTP